ncbi:Biotin--(acetyl-CoA-carboxylase) ligase [Azospirillaceae bacterium]
MPDCGGADRVVRYDRVGSTNDEARQLAAAGAGHGTVVLALRQDGGRGRRGRQWDSPAGNLYCSLILRPDRPLADGAQLSFVGALAVAETVAGLLPATCRVQAKWPNDILAAGAKIAGILLEAEATPDHRVAWLVVGIGLNLCRHPLVDAYATTDIVASGGALVTPDAALTALLVRFDHWYECWLRDGFRPVRQAWLTRAAGLGEEIAVQLARDRITGTFSGLAGDGALLVTMQNEVRQIAAGDVILSGTGARSCPVTVGSDAACD